MACRAAGIGLPCTSETQWPVGHVVHPTSGNPLVFFNSGAQDAVLLKHVGIYLDKSLTIDALHAGVVIRTEPIATWHLPRCPAPSVPVL